MRQILTFKLFDGTKMVFICDSDGKASAVANAINYSKRIFSNKKFIISGKTEIVNYEKWNKSKRAATSTFGSHNYSIAVVTKERVIIDTISASGEKTTYNTVKKIIGVNYEPYMFIYDLGQRGKMLSVVNKAQFTLSNRQKSDQLLDDFCKQLKDMPVGSKIGGELVADIITWKAMLSDIRLGVYKNAPIESIVKITCVIIYFVSPVNLSFETVPVVGQVDDLILLNMLHGAIKKDVKKYEEWRKQNQIGNQRN